MEISTEKKRDGKMNEEIYVRVNGDVAAVDCEYRNRRIVVLWVVKLERPNYVRYLPRWLELLRAGMPQAEINVLERRCFEAALHALNVETVHRMNMLFENGDDDLAPMNDEEAIQWINHDLYIDHVCRRWEMQVDDIHLQHGNFSSCDLVPYTPMG